VAVSEKRERIITLTASGFLSLLGAMVLTYYLIQFVSNYWLHTTHTPVGTLQFSKCQFTGSSGPPGQPPDAPFQVPLLGWGGLVLFVCGASFLAGGLLGRFRGLHHHRARLSRLVTAEAGDPLRTSPWPLQLALFILLLFIAVALAYEGFAAAGAHGRPEFWPITWYVRCAFDVSPLWTLLGASVTSALLGQWLGYWPKVEAKR
jgi:hypothetical protein